MSQQIFRGFAHGRRGRTDAPPSHGSASPHFADRCPQCVGDVAWCPLASRDLMAGQRVGLDLIMQMGGGKRVAGGKHAPDEAA